MTTVARWWAPTSPGIGPDDDDLFLLAAQGDGPRDLGQALLALHRVGAAACEAVATEPLSDEWLLRGVLAKARELVAPPALVTVGKALGDDRYGGLLLRDLLDDAEAAAVSLYRTCIAKGVVSPLAASRVGKVYGCPIHVLGRYTTVAVDPKAQLVVLDDVADRTLMSYVAKVVEEEGQETKVVFSKAPTEDYLERHNEAQDSSGRFVRLRSSQQKLPGGKTLHELLRETPELEAEIIAEQEAKQRPKARSLSGRKLAARSLGGRSLAGKGREGARDTERSTARRSVRLTQRDSVRQTVHAASALAFEAAPKLPLGQRDVPDTLTRRPELDGVGQLGHGVAYVLPGAEWNAFKSATGSARGNRAVFRAGALQTYANGAERFGDYDEDLGHNGAEHEKRVLLMGELMHAKDSSEGVADYQVRTFDHRRKYGNLTGEEYAAAVHREKETFLKELGVSNVARELQFVQSADDADDESLTVLVYLPPSPGRETYNRPDRRVWEVVVEADKAVGVDHGHGQHTDIELDPNLPLAVTDVVRASDTSVDRFFQRVGPDGTRGFFRNVVRVARADDSDIAEAQKKRGVGKAEKHAERSQDFQRMLLAGLIRRDPETGEFTDTTGGVKETPVPTRKPARSLAGRKLAGRKLAAPKTAQATERSSSRETTRHTERTSNRMTSRQLTRLVLTQERHDRVTYLDDSYSYAVLDSGYKGSDMDLLVNENGLHFLEQTHDRPVNVELGLHSRLNRNDRELDVKDAIADLVREQDKAWTAQPIRGGIWKSLPGTYRLEGERGDVEEHLSAIAYELEDAVGKDADIGMLRAVWNSDEKGNHVTFYVNKQPMAEQYLVRYENFLSQGPLELTSEGESRLFSADGIRNWLQIRYEGVLQGGTFARGSSDELPVPRVHTFVATTRPHEP